MGVSSVLARAAASVGRAAVVRCGAVLSRPDARDFSSSFSDNCKPAIVDVGMFVVGEEDACCSGGEYWVAASTIFTRGRAGGLYLSKDLVLGSRWALDGSSGEEKWYFLEGAETAGSFSEGREADFVEVEEG